MSDLPASPDRRRRADARRSRATIIEAAITLLGERADASMEEIAAAAGVARQTVYAHFRSRDLLLGVIVDQVTAETTAALNAVHPAGGSARRALEEWLAVSWGVTERYRLLLTVSLPVADAEADHERHLPVMERLAEILRHGRETGEFTAEPAAGWLVAATISLAHAAGQEVAAGRMTEREAGTAYRDSVLRLVAP